MLKGSQKAMVVAGVMSGTSADGVDVAIVRVSPGTGVPKVKLLTHTSFAYPKPLRAQAMRAMEGEALAAGEFSRLNWALGSFYAECVEKAVAQFGKKIALVGLHGQTVFHEAGTATWQMGEAAVLRERLGVPVVSDFRPADMEAGGQGAPLVPMLDFCVFHSPVKNRILLNLGGIANVTAIPAGAGMDDLLAFDTGPANMVIDAMMQRGFAKPFDTGGKRASKGLVLASVVAEVMQEAYFAEAPPKTCGREQFGATFAERFAGMCSEAGGTAADAVATATSLTATSVLDAYMRFCWSHLGQRAPLAKGTELIVAGGGVKNETLMRELRTMLEALGVKVKTMDEFGMDAQAKEAVAFALLAWLSFHHLPGNVAAATGAKGSRVLGKITC